MTATTRVARVLSGRLTPFLRPPWREEEYAIARRWLRGERVDGGPSALEAALAPMTDGVVTVTSTGRAALSLAVRRTVRPGAQVVIPSFACSAVADAVRAAGCQPRLADVGADLNLTADTVEAAWTKDVGGVVVVHLGGVPVDDATEIARLAHERGAVVVDDAAHAPWGGRPRGWADASVFSAGLGKTVFGPAGGAVALRDRVEELPAEPEAVVRRRLIRFLRRFTTSPVRQGVERVTTSAVGRIRRNGPGFVVATCAPVDAALAASQLARIDEIVAIRQENAERWRLLLADLPIRLAPSASSTCTKVWAIMPNAVDASRVRTALWRAGVETEDLYVPLHLRDDQPAARAPSLATTDALWQRVFSLPARPDLAEEDWDRIADGAARVRQVLS